MASSFETIRQSPAASAPRRHLWADMLGAQRLQWVLFAPVALGTGILLWFLLPWNAERQAALLAALAVALLGLAANGLARRLVVAAGLLVALGLVVAEFRTHAVAAPHLHHRLTAEEMTGTVAGVAIVAGGERTRILLDRDASDIDPAVRLRISLAGNPPPGVEPGARIAVTAPLGPIAGPTVPGAYDPARRAWYEGISASGRAMAPPRLLAPPAHIGLDRWRVQWGNHIASGLGGAENGTAGAITNSSGDAAGAITNSSGDAAGAIAVALTVGEQGRLSPELADAFRLSGLAHILTVSGFHVATVVSGVFLLLRWLVALWPWLALRIPSMHIAAVGAGLAGTLYTIISGSEVPAVRAAIAAWIALGALMLGRNPVSLRLLAFAAFLILLARPEALLGASLQLSFAAVTTLVLVTRSPLGQRLADSRNLGFFARLPRHLALMFLTSLAIELALMPIALVHFGRTGVYGALANLLAIPLTGFIIMPLLGAWLLLSAVGLGGLVGWALIPALDALAGIATTAAGLPGSSLVVPPVSLAGCILLGAGGVLAALLVGRARLAGVAVLAAGIVWAVAEPRPDIFVSADGRQLGVVADGRLHMLRDHRSGYVVNSWAEHTAASADRRVADLPGARCFAGGCLVDVNGLAILALTDSGDDARRPRPALCAMADVVVSAIALPAACAPRWLRLDPPDLKASGAVAIRSRQRRMQSVADLTGDRPWSPSALPGHVPSLLGGSRWTGMMVE